MVIKYKCNIVIFIYSINNNTVGSIKTITLIRQLKWKNKILRDVKLSKMPTKSVLEVK